MPRLFGVEIEFGHDDRREAVESLRDAGLPVLLNGSHHGWDRQAWVIKPDGSVPGGECVSPPLDFDDPSAREQVNTAIKALRRCGARSIPQAGIHVHVDAADLDAQQVAAVARVFVKFEDLIYRIAASGWNRIRGNSGGWSYCKPLPEDFIRRLPRVRTESDLAQAWRGVYGSDRYRGVNLSIWFDSRRIEFRVFNSSLNPDRVQAYIALCVALVEDARRGNRRSINKAYRLGDMIQLAATDPEALKRLEKNAFHRLLQVLRYEAGLSLEDMRRLGRVWKDSVPQPQYSSH